MMSRLGEQLNVQNSFNGQSSIFQEDLDQRKLIALIEDKDKTIRKLNKRIEKLEETLRHSLKARTERNRATEETPPENMHLNLLRAELEKTKRLQDIIDEIIDRINLILNELSKDNSLIDNTEEIRMFLRQLGPSRNDSLSSHYLEQEVQHSLSIQGDWNKKIDLLQSAICSMRGKLNSFRDSSQLVTTQNYRLRLELLEIRQNYKSPQQIYQLVGQLKEQKRQRQRLKKLLQKAQFQKNGLLNRISATVLKQAQNVKAKSKEQLVQYSKELQYRVIDLQKQKESMMKEHTKDKQDELKKYQDFLNKLRIIKGKTIMNRSCA